MKIINLPVSLKDKSDIRLEAEYGCKIFCRWINEDGVGMLLVE